MSSVGSRIRLLREALGLSQEEFGLKLGLKKSTISLNESGRNAVKESTILAACREFGVSYDWLTEGIGPMYVPQSDSDIELITRAMEGKNENKKQLIRILSAMPDELLDEMISFLKKEIK